MGTKSLRTDEPMVESAQSSGTIRMNDFKVGERVLGKLSGGRLLDAEMKLVIDTTERKAPAGIVRE